MTKSELKGLKVDDRRAELLRIFEDPENEFPEMTGDQLNTFIDLNWEEIEAFYQETSDGPDGEESTEDETPEDDQGAEEDVSETESDSSTEDQDLSRPNPATDLRYGRPR